MRGGALAHSSVSARRRVGAIDAPACEFAAAMLAGSLACDLGRGSTLELRRFTR
jgi:hypothetical protein